MAAINRCAMKAKTILLRWLACALILTSVRGAQQVPTAVPATQAAPAGAEAIGVRVQPSRGAGLFVGVNEFGKDGQLNALRYAVNDAVAQAHLFALELRLFPATNCVLALAGEPTTPALRQQLAALAGAGARRVGASKTDLLLALNQVSLLAGQAEDLLVVSLSSHGFEDAGTVYVMPADGLQAFLGETALRLGSVEQLVGRSRAGRRLMIVDACRERALKEARGGGTGMSAAFRAALGQAGGQAVLASCDAGQMSVEVEELGHGVFTYHLLQGLRGQAQADARGFITLGTAAEYLEKAAGAWLERHRPDLKREVVPRPWTKGPENLRDLPLAMVRVGNATPKDSTQRSKAALGYVEQSRRQNPGLISGSTLENIEMAIEMARGDDLVRLMEKLETLAASKAGSLQEFLKWWDARASDYAAQNKIRYSAADLTAAAAKGDGKAMVLLGDMYFCGIEGQVKYPEALKAYQRAVEAKHPAALGRMANLLKQVPGQGGGREEWERLYREGAAMGDPVAMVNWAYWSTNRVTTTNTEAQSLEGFVRAIPQLRRLAGFGDVVAMEHLSWCYLRGFGLASEWEESVRLHREATSIGSAQSLAARAIVLVDKEEAAELLLKAANRGNAEAMNYLGVRLATGVGVATNRVEAIRWYQRAAELGHSAAMSNLARFCLVPHYLPDGTLAPADPPKAVQWFLKSAEFGYPPAMHQLAICYRDGKGASKAPDLAMRWSRQAAEFGDASAMQYLGSVCCVGNDAPRDPAEGFRWHLRAAERGNTVAMVDSGIHLQSGNGVAQNHQEAVAWFRRAATGGHRDGMYQLGQCFALGRGVVLDKQEAVRWYRASAEAGSASGMVALGTYYFTGLGVTRDATQAFEWFQKSAQLGNPVAMNWLGTCYLGGIGVAKDEKQSTEWYRKSARAGNKSSQDVLTKRGLTW